MISSKSYSYKEKFKYPGFPLRRIQYQLSPSALIESTLLLKQGELNDTGALIVKTGKFTGRSPRDKYIVADEFTKLNVNWNEYNISLKEAFFDQIYSRMMAFICEKEIWIREAIVCADSRHKLNVRIINDTPWANLFSYNMFLRPGNDDLKHFKPDWEIIQISSFKADPEVEGVRSENFSIINFTRKIILIGGTGYTGEIKKGMFTVLNFLLPLEKHILSMHCSANSGSSGDTALFFGLSGTGKTTLSAAYDRSLIGDDEHGWSDHGIFNFEGGCYAKCNGLNKEQEPQIYQAIRNGALLENVTFLKDSNMIDYNSTVITENTRVSYPLHFINNIKKPSLGEAPTNIFFLTCDAYGILPPVSKLTIIQAMYHFLSGYTAKIAGTEEGITEPVSTFSTCFGAPFLPLSSSKYVELFAEKLISSKAKVWLVNTGWTGGSFGVGKRISLKHTRSIISAIFKNELDKVNYINHKTFGLAMPLSCPNVPSGILNPENTWEDNDLYNKKAEELAQKFIVNFRNYDMKDLMAGGPVLGSSIDLS